MMAQKRRILVVDDNRDSAMSLGMLLNFLGNDTCTAHDGPSAIDVAEAFRPHVVLLDLGLPVMNGLEVCRTIRDRSWGKHVLMVALTGWSQEEDRRRSQEAGFNFHLVKPVTLESLEQVLATDTLVQQVEVC